LAETLNFTRAAEKCCVAQSALSQQIARLETVVGAPLFVRSSRSVRLTPAGQFLASRAPRVLTEMEATRSEFDAYMGAQQGRVRVGLVQRMERCFDVAEVLALYRVRHPYIEMSVTHGCDANMVDAVEGHAVDVAVVGMDETVPEELVRVCLTEEPLVAVASPEHPLADQLTISLSDVDATGSVIHAPRGSGLRREVEAALSRGGVPAATQFEVGQIDDMLGLVRSGIGVAIVPRSAAHALYGVCVFELSDPEAVHRVGLVYDRRLLMPATIAFVRLLREHANPQWHATPSTGADRLSLVGADPTRGTDGRRIRA
jgi:DNA-binding transcriptional LysR family regulator